MSLDKKLKQAAFDTLFTFFIKNKDRSAKYAAKGIIDAAITISKDHLSDQTIKSLTSELIYLMDDLKKHKINEVDIKNWVITKFHLL